MAHSRDCPSRLRIFELCVPMPALIDLPPLVTSTSLIHSTYRRLRSGISSIRAMQLTQTNVISHMSRVRALTYSYKIHSILSIRTFPGQQHDDGDDNDNDERTGNLGAKKRSRTGRQLSWSMSRPRPHRTLPADATTTATATTTVTSTLQAQYAQAPKP